MKERGTLLASIHWVGKAALVWLALLCASLASGAMVQAPTPAGVPDGPIGAVPAMLVVDAMVGLTLSALASRTPGGFWRRAAIGFVVLFGAETVLSDIEALYFGRYLHLPGGLLAAVAVMNLVKSAAGAAAAAALWRVTKPTTTVARPPLWRTVPVALIYPVFYFGAGALIAWRSSAVRTYYGQGIHIDNAQLLLLQLARGAVWAGLAWLIVAGTRGSVWAKAALTGSCFAVFMALPLLFPNGFMPWAVRRMHLAEIGISNLLFGATAALVLAAPAMVQRERSARPSVAA